MTIAVCENVANVELLYFPRQGKVSFYFIFEKSELVHKSEKEDWNIYGRFGGKRAGYKSPDFFREKKLTDTFPEAVQWYNKPLTCEMWDMWATVTDIIVVVLDLELSCQSPLPARLRHRPQLGGNNQHTIINWRANTLYQQLSSWHQKIKSPREKALKSLFTLNAKL